MSEQLFELGLTHVDEVDVLFVVATAREFDAVFASSFIHFVEKEWVQDPSGMTPIVYRRSLLTCSGRLLRVGVAAQVRMGPLECVWLCSRLIEKLHPKQVIMVGVCAGKRKDTQPGDLCVAKTIVPAFGGGKYEGETTKTAVYSPVQGPISLTDKLVQTLSELVSNRAGSSQWRDDFNEFKGRRNRALQVRWPTFLKEIRMGLDDPSRALSTKETPAPSEVLITKVAHVADVIKVATFFKELAQTRDREITALEMESGAIGYVAVKYGLPWFFVKGVMDHGDDEKSDTFYDTCTADSLEFALMLLRHEVLHIALERPVAVEQNHPPAATVSIARLAEGKRQYRKGENLVAMSLLDEVFEGNRYFHTAWAQFIICCLRTTRFQRAANELREMDRISRELNLDRRAQVPWQVRRVEFLMRTGRYPAAVKEGERLINDFKHYEASRYQSDRHYWECCHVVAQAHFNLYRLSADPSHIEHAERYWSEAFACCEKDQTTRPYWIPTRFALSQYLLNRRDPNFSPELSGRVAKAITTSSDWIRAKVADRNQEQSKRGNIHTYGFLNSLLTDLWNGSLQLPQLSSFVEGETANTMDETNKVAYVSVVESEAQNMILALFPIREAPSQRVQYLFYSWLAATQIKEMQ